MVSAQTGGLPSLQTEGYHILKLVADVWYLTERDSMKKEKRIRTIELAGAFMLLAVLLLFFAGIHHSAAAAQTEMAEGSGDSPWMSEGDSLKQKSGINSVAKGYYSRDLNKRARKVYKAIYKRRKSKKKVRVKLSPKVTLKVSRSSFRSGKIWQHKKIKALNMIVTKAATALQDSNIDSYWISYYKWKFYFHYRWLPHNKVSVRIDSIKLKPVERYRGARKEFSAVKKNAKKVAENIKRIRPDKSRFTTARMIYEYLIRTVSYGRFNGVEYSPASALLPKYNGTSVCDGYARAFKMICDYCGVPCLYVGSTYDDHAWNMVQLENGNWYGVDVTWGDEGYYADYRWFMYGRDEVTSGKHPGNAIYIINDSLYRFSLPALAPSGVKYRRAA